MRALFVGSLNERIATLNTIHKAAIRQAEWSRLRDERDLPPDEHLDDLGWSIFDIAIRMDMRPQDAVVIAMDGNLRQRARVMDDMWHRHIRHLTHDFPELGLPDPTDADDRLAYWRTHLAQPSFVYFVQQGENGPVKIGRAVDPERRVATLQTGNAIDLHLREVVPGDSTLESTMHQRFADARIRGEWFGADYLPLILAYAEGIAESAVLEHDGGPSAPVVTAGGTRVRDDDTVLHARREIERLWLDGHTVTEIARYLTIAPIEIREHMEAMRKTSIYTLDRKLSPTHHGMRQATTRRAA
jgi:hypothetical protein